MSNVRIYKNKQILPIIFSFTIFVAIVITVSTLALFQIKNETRIRVRNTLQAVARTTQEAIYIWVDQEKSIIKKLAMSQTVIKETLNLLKVEKNKKNLCNSNAMAKLRSFFDLYLKELNALGFFIIDKNYISIGSMRNSNVGTLNIIAKERKHLLEKAFRGETVFIPSMVSDVPLPDSSGRIGSDRPTLFVATPIYYKKKIIAVLTIRLDPTRDFSRISGLARIGETGETYFFDKGANMLTESRFVHQLRNLGIIGINKSAINNVKLYDPGYNLLDYNGNKDRGKSTKFTKMAEDAINGNTGYDIDGYRDYRGIMVVGYWTWDRNLDIGFATEIDLADAMKSYFQTRNIIIILTLVISITVVVISYILFSIIRKHMVQLQEINKSLEVKVKDRTKKLKNTTVKLEAANRKLAKLAVKDKLTGLGNRRSLEDKLKHLWGNWIRNNTCISVAMIDIDFFKKLNDTYGHQKGDECLEIIGSLLKDNKFLSRSDDIIARYGGEEFIIMMSGTTKDDAVFICNKISSAIKDEKIPNKNSTVENVDYVTVSIGVAVAVPTIDLSYSELIKMADDTLYKAKENGRNRIEVYE